MDIDIDIQDNVSIVLGTISILGNGIGPSAYTTYQDTRAHEHISSRLYKHTSIPREVYGPPMTSVGRSVHFPGSWL